MKTLLFSVNLTTKWFKMNLKKLPLKYCLQKMRNTPIGATFIVESRKCSRQTLLKAATKAFKLVFKQIQSFDEESHFYFDYRTYQVVENSKLVIDRLDQITTKKNAKWNVHVNLILVYFLLSYRKYMPKLLLDLIDFDFAGGPMKKIPFL